MAKATTRSGRALEAVQLRCEIFDAAIGNRDAAIVRAYETGVSVPLLVKVTGLTRTRVYAILQREGARKPGGK